MPSINNNKEWDVQVYTKFVAHSSRWYSMLTQVKHRRWNQNVTIRPDSQTLSNILHIKYSQNDKQENVDRCLIHKAR